MKTAEYMKKIREMSGDELKVQATEAQEQMFRMRFQLAMGQTESLKKMRELRKERARMQTILQEKAKVK